MRELGNAHCRCTTHPDGCGSVRQGAPRFGGDNWRILTGLRRAAAGLEDAIEATDTGLTASAAAAHALISSNPGISQACLSVSLGLDRASVVAIVDRLERQDLTERTVTPGDRRRHSLYAKPGAASPGPRLTGALDQAIAGRLTPSEAAQLLRLLAKLGGPAPEDVPLRETA